MEQTCTCHAFGLYRGKVIDTVDPEGLLRIRVIVPQIFGPEPLKNWAWPCVDNAATATVPPLGSVCWVMFVGGDVEHPVWVGTWRTI